MALRINHPKLEKPILGSFVELETKGPVKRKLEEKDPGTYKFTCTVIGHDSESMTIKINFSEITGVSKWNKRDIFSILLIEPTVFKSAITLKSIKANSFEVDGIILQASIPR
jgi:hypothetical protein